MEINFAVGKCYIIGGVSKAVFFFFFKITAGNHGFYIKNVPEQFSKSWFTKKKKERKAVSILDLHILTYLGYRVEHPNLDVMLRNFVDILESQRITVRVSRAYLTKYWEGKSEPVIVFYFLRVTVWYNTTLLSTLFQVVFIFSSLFLL